MKTGMANTHKHITRADMGKAHAGRCRACAHEGHAQVGAWRAQARNRYAHTKGFVDVGPVGKTNVLWAGQRSINEIIH